MIKKIKQDGGTKDQHIYLSTHNFLKELDENDKEYIVGIDWGSEHYEDNTVISYFTEDENGNFVLEGTKIIINDVFDRE